MDNIDAKIVEIANQLANKCLNVGVKLAAAESCTGGWLAKSLTDIAGSSQWFEGGFVTYSNAAKVSMISVQKKSLDSHGAVSETIVIEMARGVLAHLDATLSVAISGIAGPGGGSNDKPVGFVWFAFAHKHNSEITVITEKHVFDGDRYAIRQQAVLSGLTGLLRIVASN